MILVTGGAGFIGSNFVLDWLAQSDEPVINIDKLTYAGNLNNLASVLKDPRHVFVKGDICDTALITSLLTRHQPRAIVHFAAESHVDRSIGAPAAFIATNINGTFSLLSAARDYWNGLPAPENSASRLVKRIITAAGGHRAVRNTTIRPDLQRYRHAPLSFVSNSRGGISVTSEELTNIAPSNCSL